MYIASSSCSCEAVAAVLTTACKLYGCPQVAAVYTHALRPLRAVLRRWWSRDLFGCHYSRSFDDIRPIDFRMRGSIHHHSLQSLNHSGRPPRRPRVPPARGHRLTPALNLSFRSSPAKPPQRHQSRDAPLRHLNARGSKRQDSGGKGSPKGVKRVLSAVVHSLATPGFTTTGGIKTATDSVSPSGARGVKHRFGSQEEVRMARNNHTLTTVRAASVQQRQYLKHTDSLQNSKRFSPLTLRQLSAQIIRFGNKPHGPDSLRRYYVGT